MLLVSIHSRNTKFGGSGGIHWWVSTTSGVSKPFSLVPLSLGLKLTKWEHKQAEQVNLLFLVIRFVFCESYITIVLITPRWPSSWLKPEFLTCLHKQPVKSPAKEDFSIKTESQKKTDRQKNPKLAVFPPTFSPGRWFWFHGVLLVLWRMKLVSWSGAELSLLS